MSVINAVPLLAAAGGDYTISRSVRLRSSASAYFNRTFTGTNRLKWTWSGWVKRGVITSTQVLFAAPITAGVTEESLLLAAGDQLLHNDGTTGVLTQTNAVLRDASAWYHIVYAYDSANATQANRGIWYINGVQQSNSTNAIGSSRNSYINHSQSHGIGRFASVSSNYFDGYMTEVNFIDGQALTPSSFGENDTITGVWKPKKYAGTYGTNGFYLNFSDNSNNTATTIGKDYSGNGNNWTPNNISVTSGVTYDSMLDVPTLWADGGNGRGNYSVLNPLMLAGAGIDVAQGNQYANRTAAGWARIAASFGVTSGKWYWEILPNNNTTSQMIGVGLGNTASNHPGYESNTYGFYTSTGQKYNNNTGSSYGSYTAGQLVGVALDLDNGKIWFSCNGTWQASGDPAAGTNAAFTGISGTYFPEYGLFSASTNGYANFGQRPFTYTPPSGFKALNTQNLPDSTIKKGNQYMDVAIQTGNTTGRTVSGLAFQPDLVWVKNRAGSTNRRWGLVDSVRGVNKTLTTQATDAEVTSQTDLLTAFNSDGFTIGADAGLYGWNGFAESYAHFVWKESATAGFDIVTFTNPSSGSASFAHSLGVKPSMIITKARSGTGNWTVTHKSLGANMQDYYLLLNGTAASTTSAGIWGGEPTSSVFYSSASLQVPSATMVAYLFSEVAGFSKFGNYAGNGSADGPFVFCGFRPRYVMIKRTDSANDWLIIDTSRNPYNVTNLNLWANLSSAEGTADRTDVLSNGFKLRNSLAEHNASGGTYIYAAFAENPFKNALAR